MKAVKTLFLIAIAIALTGSAIYLGLKLINKDSGPPDLILKSQAADVTYTENVLLAQTSNPTESPTPTLDPSPTPTETPVSTPIEASPRAEVTSPPPTELPQTGFTQYSLGIFALAALIIFFSFIY